MLSVPKYKNIQQIAIYYVDIHFRFKLQSKKRRININSERKSREWDARSVDFLKLMFEIRITNIFKISNGVYDNDNNITYKDENISNFIPLD